MPKPLKSRQSQLPRCLFVPARRKLGQRASRFMGVSGLGFRVMLVTGFLLPALCLSGVGLLAQGYTLPYRWPELGLGV